MFSAQLYGLFLKNLRMDHDVFYFRNLIMSVVLFHEIQTGMFLASFVLRRVLQFSLLRSFSVLTNG